MELILLLVGPGVVLFLMELIVLRLTGKGGRWLRFLPLLGLLVPAGLAIQSAVEGGWFWELGVLAAGIMAAVMLLGWGLAWIGRPRVKDGGED